MMMMMRFEGGSAVKNTIFRVETTTTLAHRLTGSPEGIAV